MEVPNAGPGNDNAGPGCQDAGPLSDTIWIIKVPKIGSRSVRLVPKNKAVKIYLFPPKSLLILPWESQSTRTGSWVFVWKCLWPLIIHGNSNRPAWTHGFNAKISFEKCAPSPKILPKKCPKSAFQTKPAKFDTFWPFSLASVHIFQNRFLRNQPHSLRNPDYIAFCS